MFYGSQTGTAEEFANRLAKDAARYGMKGMVADTEECEMVMFIFSHFCNNVVSPISQILKINISLQFGLSTYNNVCKAVKKTEIYITF